MKILIAFVMICVSFSPLPCTLGGNPLTEKEADHMYGKGLWHLVPVVDGSDVQHKLVVDAVENLTDEEFIQKCMTGGSWNVPGTDFTFQAKEKHSCTEKCKNSVRNMSEFVPDYLILCYEEQHFLTISTGEKYNIFKHLIPVLRKIPKISSSIDLPYSKIRLAPSCCLRTESSRCKGEPTVLLMHGDHYDDDAFPLIEVCFYSDKKTSERGFWKEFYDSREKVGEFLCHEVMVGLVGEMSGDAKK